MLSGIFSIFFFLQQQTQAEIRIIAATTADAIIIIVEVLNHFDSGFSSWQFNSNLVSSLSWLI